MLRRSLLKAFLAAPLGLLFGKKADVPPVDTQEAIDCFLKEYGDFIAEELGWPKGSVFLVPLRKIDAENIIEHEHTSVYSCYCPKCIEERRIKRICYIDASKCRRVANIDMSKMR